MYYCDIGSWIGFTDLSLLVLTIFSSTQIFFCIFSVSPMSSNPTKDRILPVAKKPRIVRKYMCPNCNCQKSFKLEKQWKQHVSASKECFKAVRNVLQDKQTQVLSLTEQTRPRTRSSYAILPTPEANDETMEIDNTEHFMIDDSSDEEVMDDRKPAAGCLAYSTWMTKEWRW